MATESPEGIVVYSISGVNIITGNNTVIVSPNAYIDLTDVVGVKHTSTEKLILTDSIIETLDLISEGVIEGPLSGQWIFSGNIGQTGWSSSYFSGYAVPSGFENFRWLRSVYWNQLPVLNDIGQFNFQSVDLSFTKGLPNGDVLQQLDSEETTSRPIGTILYAQHDAVKQNQTFRINNRNCKGVIINIKVPNLSNTNQTNGNTERTFVQYQISYRPIFSSVLKVSTFYPPIIVNLFGKIVSAGGFINSTRIDFNLTSFLSNNGKTILDVQGFLDDLDFIGWEILIERLTPDSTSAFTNNLTYIDSITELYGSQLSYPNSAIVRQTFNGKFFSSIPTRAFECNFLKIKVPANYDPVSRTYSTTGDGTTNGYWNGTFSSDKKWTNNPAWCFYDLITNNRYGLGKFVDNIDMNKFDLYNIGQYCDELVADGYGGLEPRFTCNAWIAQKEEAYKVVNDMASIFRGMVYYFNGNLNATQDAPKQTRITFTNGNVENGDFNYNSTSKNTRQSIAVVRYNDPKNFYQPAIEYVEDLNSIRRYGVRELPIIAFGCTSRGQAIRLGRWALYSNNIETETISFNAGLEAITLRCGDVFEVSDFNRKGKRYGGRLYSINNINTGAVLTLDSNIDLQTGLQYSISIVTPSYFYDPSQVTGLTSNDYSNIYRPFVQKFNFSGDNTYQSGNFTIVNLPTGLDSNNYIVTGNPVWSIELGPNSQNYTGNFYFTNQSTDLYRVLNIRETDVHKYEIVGLLYSPQKFNQIDSGLVFQQSQIDGITTTPSTPHNLALSAYKLNNSQSYIQYSFLVDNYHAIANYKVFITTGNFLNSSIPDNSLLGATLPPSVINATYLTNLSGVYKFRIYSYNNINSTFSTGFASGSVLVNAGLPIQDVIVGGLGLN